MYPTVVQFNIMKTLTSLTIVKYVLISISDNRKTPSVAETTTSICFNNGSEKAYDLLIDQNIYVSILTTDVASSHGSGNALRYIA